MATEHKEQVLVVGEMSSLKDLIELAKERGPPCDATVTEQDRCEYGQLGRGST
jgi:hypothetical protein